MKRVAVLVGAFAFAALLMAAMFDLPVGEGGLRAAVSARMAVSGVEHPVTAVLLNFRGYDTLLEVGVLLLALIVILAAGIDPAADRPRDAKREAEGMRVARGLARLAVPLLVLVAIYLLWAGAFRPGGAFQAAAVLAAGAVLLHLTGLLPGWRPPAALLRTGLVAGFLVFLGIAAVLGLRGDLLQYPPEQAGLLILLIEAGLTVTLGLILAGLFLLLSRDAGDPS